MLTVGADDLLFSVMKELTFSYLESPAGLWRRVSKSESGPKVSCLIRNWKGSFFPSLYFCQKTLVSLLSNGAVAKVWTDLLYLTDERAPCSMCVSTFGMIFAVMLQFPPHSGLLHVWYKMLVYIECHQVSSYFCFLCACRKRFSLKRFSVKQVPVYRKLLSHVANHNLD